MNTLSEETPRVKSSGSSAGSSGKKRRRSIDITSSEKSSGEEVNNVPSYLRGSTDPKFPKLAEPVEVTKKDAALPSQKILVMKTVLVNKWERARMTYNVSNGILLLLNQVQFIVSVNRGCFPDEGRITS
ncbi:hypothetical protein Tco_0973764 [Tanacetum coccineum]|uniref:Uncharacterized protein n=1 Tax=Tanacetum coccineum TaxID=301880 RepID=A0ABQ5EAL5_9ASTR